MKVHHLNCCTVCPAGGRLFFGGSKKMVCHCLLLETSSGLVLIDTGVGLKQMQTRPINIEVRMLILGGAAMAPHETAIRQIEKLGFSANDVRHIILTHLDPDHAGGLSDFPSATVHLLDTEYQTAKSEPISRIEKVRYGHVLDQREWALYRSELGGDRWFGFDAVHKLKGLPPEILLIPLVGHTRGHTGVAIKSDSGWLLHAGDAYFSHLEIEDHPKCPIGLSIMQRLLEVDRHQRLMNQKRLRELKKLHGNEITLFCSHDSSEFDDLV